MNTCRTCKHWSIGPDKFRDRSPFWKAKRIHGECSCKKFVYGGDNAPKESKDRVDTLEYCDSEEYFAQFSTGPEFGCIHHQERDKPLTSPPNHPS